MGREGPDQWQNDPEEEITVEFRDDVFQDNIEPKQLQAENEDQITVQGNDEIAEQIVPVQEDGLDVTRRSTRSRRKPEKFGHNIYDSKCCGL